MTYKNPWSDYTDRTSRFAKSSFRIREIKQGGAAASYSPKEVFFEKTNKGTANVQTEQMLQTFMTRR